MITICTTLPWKCFGTKTKIKDKLKSTDIKFIHLTVQCTTLNVKHNCSSHKKQTHTKVFTYLPTACVCVCVSVCASSVQGFSMHYDTSETATKTERQRRTETETGRERQSSYSQMNDWQIAELCTLHILPHKLCPNVVRVCVRECASVCQSNFSLALLLKCEWQLDALIVTMNCISSAIPCSVYATADSC